jgi:hypothetical protein
MDSQDKNWAFRILPGSFDGNVRWLGCLSAMDRGVRTRIRLAAQPPLAFSRSAAVAFAYRPGHRVRFSVNDWRRRFAAPGHGIACDAPRHGRLVYYSVFVTSGFALIWRGSRSDQRILCRNRLCRQSEGLLDQWAQPWAPCRITGSAILATATRGAGLCPHRSSST